MEVFFSLIRERKETFTFEVDVGNDIINLVAIDECQENVFVTFKFSCVQQVVVITNFALEKSKII